MISRCHVLAVLLLLAPAVAAETIYKYRRADGRMIYSNRPIPGVELIETFEYRPAKPAAARVDRSKSDAAGEARIKAYLAALDKAWTEVQEASKALAAAEERLRAGVEPESGEREGVASGTAPPTVGGLPPSAAPAVGGSLSGRRGRASPEYVARMQVLEAGVQAARTRLAAALRRYNELR
jgi:hypothetical protein